MSEEYYLAIPMTMEQVVKEVFNPTIKRPLFKGYEPHNYFKRISSFRSETKNSWELWLNEMAKSILAQDITNACTANSQLERTRSK